MTDTTDTAKTAEAAPAPAAPRASGGVSATAYAKALADGQKQASTIDALRSQLGELQKAQAAHEQAAGQAGAEATKAAKAKAAAAREAAKAQTAAAEESAQAAWGAAKGAYVQAALGDIKQSDYLRLAPAVELNESKTGLTAESMAALDAFRAEHPELFTRQGGGPFGSTPVSTTGGAGATAWDAETLQAFRLSGIKPGEAERKLADKNFAGIIGWSAPNKLQGRS